MNLSGYYRRATIYPSLLSIFITTIYSYNVNRSYKSEWLTSDAVTLFSMMAAFVYAIIICLLSLTLFFNKYERVRQSRNLSLLSWFLLPIGFIATVIVSNIRLMISDQTDDRSDFIFIILLNLPFMVALIWSYVRYRRAVFIN